ncbi:MAG: hypothetical protein JG761_171 [Proteiniphilum sp.]|nr:hypothetical protein [Proteiniphilum sp.]
MCETCCVKNKFFLLLLFFPIFGASLLNAQNINDALKNQMQESIMTPGIPLLQQSHQQYPIQLNWDKERSEVLKVSPNTRLPTKYDLIPIPPKKEEMKINMQIIPANASPINMLPPGSVEYVFDGKQVHIQSNAGKLVVPSGSDFDLVRSYRNRRKEKQRERLQRILKAY